MGWCKTYLGDDTHDWVRNRADDEDVRVDEVISECVEVARTAELLEADQ